MAVGTMLVGGCMGAFAPTQDPLTTWSQVPLPANPALARAATAPGFNACASGQAEAPRIVLQDQRTISTAAFLTAGTGFTGSCLVTLTGGASSGSARSDPLDPMDRAIVVDERSTGGIGGGTATLLGGRSRLDVTRVQIALPNGTRLEASVGNGHWLAWWPGSDEAGSVTAFDGAGNVVAALDDTTPGFQAK